MQITMRTQGLDTVQKELKSLSGPKARDAYSKAVNDTAYQVRRTMQAEFTRVFDRVTPYIRNSAYVKQATPDSLVATIEPTYLGGKGIDPQQILRAQEAGGSRRDKRSESALRRVGILPNGFQTAIPKDPFPGSDDGRGNIKGSFTVQLISYFQAFGEQGYRANMTKKRIDKLANRGATERGVKSINGVVYFVSYGRLRGSHLKPGIWAKTGIHGVDVKPVLMFVRAAHYKPLLSMEKISQAADADNYLDKRMRFRIRQAAGV